MDVKHATTPIAYRSRFPIFERLVYINSCSQGALSNEVRAAYEAYLTDWEYEGAPWEYWVEQAGAARAAFARLIGADSQAVAVTTSVSAAVSSVATGIDLVKRPRIVVTDLEFPTIGQIWHAQETRGAEVVHVPAVGGRIALEQIADVVDERTSLVSITAVSYRNGFRLPVREIVDLAHARGARVLLDAYQALGTYPIDVRELEVDFLTGGALKYLLGSAGLAFLWASPDVAGEIMPLATGWFADENIFEMDVHDYSPATDARRFESGTPPVPAIYAAIAGMALVESVGVAEIERHVRQLNDELIEGVQGLGGTLATPTDPSQRGALICIRATDAPELVRALAGDGVVTSERDGNLRISAHLYNNRDDVGAVLASLERHRALLAQ